MRFWLILILGLVSISSFSQNVDTLKITNVDSVVFLKQVDSLSLTNDTVFSKSDSLLVAADTSETNQIDTSSQVILLIGDSMAGMFAYALEDYCKFNNHKLYAVAWESAQTKWFAQTDTLNFFLKKYSPSMVFIFLGSNETYFRDNYEQKRGEYVRKIVNQLDTNSIPFIWIGPPNWNNDTALNSVIRKYVGADRFFTSYKVSLNNPNFHRWRDKIHPTLSADRLLMDSLATWIMSKSRYKIKLFKPLEFSEKPKANLLILKPLPKGKR